MLKVGTTSVLCIGAALSILQTESFVLNLPKAVLLTTSSTVLFPHQFGGYDANQAGVIAWTPSEAAEFVLWHLGTPRQGGMQLAPMIKGWSGDDVGEFLGRLYLGEVIKEEERISFCPSNVRDPQWLGLSDEGFAGMKDMLVHALPDEVLSPEGLARCAHAFLMKEHRWPAQLKNGKEGDNAGDKDNASKARQFESDSFTALGYSAKFARVLGSVKRERISEFTASEIVSMLTLPEHSIKSQGYSQLPDFYDSLGFELTSSEIVQTVEKLALSGWAPSTLAKFACSIEEVEGWNRNSNIAALHQTTESVSTHVSDSSAESTSTAVPTPYGDGVPAAFVPVQTSEAVRANANLD